MAKPKASLAIHATCPQCGFNLNVFQEGLSLEGDGYDNGHDQGKGGYRTKCDSCGVTYHIEAETVQAIQSMALVLLGEA